MVKTEYLVDKRWGVTRKEGDCTREISVIGFSHYGDKPYITLNVLQGGTLQFNLKEAEIIRDSFSEVLEAIAKEKESEVA